MPVLIDVRFNWYKLVIHIPVSRLSSVVPHWA